MDLLSSLLHAISLQGTLYFRTELKSPWSIRVPAHGDVARFHLCTHGECWLKVKEKDAPVRVAEGEMVLVPHGAAHILSDSPGREPMELDEVVRAAGFAGEGALVWGGGSRVDGASTRLLCGHFAYDPRAGWLLRTLPAHLHLGARQGPSPYWVEAAVRQMAHDIASGAPGAEAVVLRLSEILFIQAIRGVADEVPTGPVAALRDPQLRRALALMHDEPSEPWTVDRLARRVGMSRTSFSERMTAIVGMSPMQYLTQCRMEIASRRLRDAADGPAVSTVAAEVGYRSVGAFTKVFKRHFGIGPGAFQKRACQSLSAT